MTVRVNGAGVSHARSLVASGSVDRGDGWSFSSEDGNSILGKDEDWAAYGKWFLGVDSSADPKSKAHYKYPYGKNGKVYRAGLIAARQRAGQENETEIFDAAGRLLDEIDKKKSFDGIMQTRDMLFEIKDISEDTGTFSGYGAVFGNVDDGGDVIQQGAFSNAINNYKSTGRMPKMLWQHDPRQPIGAWKDMKEDAYGLHMVGKLSLGVAKAKEAHQLMKDGAIDGLSIGYVPVKWDYSTDQKSGKNVRVLKELDPREVSVVTMPMNGLANITNVKAASYIRTIRDFEDFLRDEGGFSNSAAKAIAASGFKSLEPRDEDSATSSLLETLRQVRAGLSA